MLIEQQKAKEQVTEKINFSKANRKENPLTYASTSFPKDISFGVPLQPVRPPTMKSFKSPSLRSISQTRPTTEEKSEKEQFRTFFKYE